MRKLGSPFRSGTLSYLILSVVLMLAIIYYYLTSPVQSNANLLIVVLSVVGATRAYLRYIRFWNLGEKRLVGDPE